MMINDLHFLGTRLRGWLSAGEVWAELDIAIAKSSEDNAFFTPYMIRRSLGIICEDFLDRDRLMEWVSGYLTEVGGAGIEDLLTFNKGKRVGVVMAGNIPLVGFTDLLAVLITGAEPIIKLSSKDRWLLPVLFPDLIYRTGEEFDKEKLDAIITMGGDDAASHFREKFAETKALLRGSRFSVGVVSGQETDQQLEALAEDILLYYGMGCRNITHLLVPKGYDFTRLGGFINTFLQEKKLTFLESQYLRNRALLSIDEKSFFDSGSFLFVESISKQVPISTLSYSFYDDKNDVENYLGQNKNNIQKIFTTFGNAQRPSLMDYPDGVDVIQLLLNI